MGYCTRCDTEKDDSAFGTRGKHLRSWCRECESKYSASRRDVARRVQRRTDQTVQLSDVGQLREEMNARFDEIATALEHLTALVNALSTHTDARPTADVNINIRTEVPEDDPRYKHVSSKLLGMDFEQAFLDTDKKRGH